MDNTEDKKENQQVDFKILRIKLAQKIKVFYPYFLIFYIAVLLFVVIFPSARVYFYWPGLHGAFIALTILTALAYRSTPFFASRSVKEEFSEIPSIPPYYISSILRDRPHFTSPGLRNRIIFFLSFFRIFFRIIRIIFSLSFSFRRFLIRIWHLLWLLSRPLLKFFIRVAVRIRAFERRDWLKVLIITLIAVFGLYKGVNAWEFIVLFYAACSVVCALDSRWSTGVALVFLAACPILLVLDRGALAEDSAISAFYFLVITVLTQIRELRHDRGTEGN
ncbi:MAG: hypothetical protein UV95_C0003G0110 [Candidatus Falkowbacteria bacterium GW2011_GWF2_43_32]|nr:MAG: hypothetical protein UV95_C0003G0110 [Candidatus Falkowbacteria bacterium GW2011_GWF2_43_32]